MTPFGFKEEHHDLVMPDWISTEVEFSGSASIMEFNEETVISKLEISEPIFKKEIKTELLNVREHTKRTGRELF